MLEFLDLRERGERLEATRLEIDPTVADTVAGILQRVFVEGDDVLIELCQRFDGADLTERGIIVTDEEFDRAERETPARAPRGPRRADRAPRATCTHASSRTSGGRSTTAFASARSCGRSQSVGCYVPGGRAVYPSSVCMTVVPAVVAGVDEIVLCTPPQRRRQRSRAPVLYAARRAGATYVAKTGGAQAVGAMAYGTESIPRVDRIVGPGQRLRDRGEAAGRGHRRDRRPRRARPSSRSWPTTSVDARSVGARPDRAGRARPRGAHVLRHHVDPDLVDARRRRARDRAADGRAPRDRRHVARLHEGGRGARPRPGRRGRERPRLRAPADPAPRPRCVPRQRAQRRRDLPGRGGPRCRSATTASRRTTCCPPRARRDSRAGCARPTTSRSPRWSR